MQTLPARVRHRSRLVPYTGAALAALAASPLGTFAPLGAQRVRGADDAFGAERPLVVEAGVIGVAQRGTEAVLAPVLGLEWAGRRASRTPLHVEAWTALGGARWSGQVALDASHRLGTPRRPFELAVGASAQQFPGAAAMAFGELSARQHVVGALAARPAGGWMGAGAGGIQRGTPTQPRLHVELGGWRAAGREGRVALAARGHWARLDGALAGDVYATVVRAPTSPTPTVPPSGPGSGGPPRTPLVLVPPPRPFRAVDLTLSAERRADVGEIAVWVGARRGPDPDATSPWRTRWQPLALASATRWMTPGVGLTATAGLQYADPLRALPALRHVSIGLRVRPAVAAVARALPARRVVAPLGEAALLVEPGPRGTRRLVAHAPAASRVALRGDLTAWRETLLERDGDAWLLPAEALALPLAPGTYRVSVRLDDGPWRPPANLPDVDDDFASRVGLLVVP